MTTEHEGSDGAAVAGRSGPMQSLLSHFCEGLEQSLEPLLEPIASVAERLGSPPTSVPSVLPGLREVEDQLALLVAKMAEQQAYVLIFGPLKSGKSTLMNAICAKYVSEVTCLPAYPCMVHVSHAACGHYQLTRYNGTTEVLEEPERLADVVAADHAALVAAIRRSEASGTDFEPQEHAPEAIRRIDVRVPAGDLAESGAVLVDTPGLYTRMKFGYDRMTRDFRDAAACAIFVVKTDNLFLDQVFAEFEELLALFGRIFLVVNLDSSKQDLTADGRLQPSLEHANPQAVVEAFENLAMSAALREARADGRLRIYPVDLLRAASVRIGAEQGSAEDAVAPGGSEDFTALLEDLTDYLNSNEYLRGFVADGLQRASHLLGELTGLLDLEPVAALKERADTLAVRQQELERSAAAIDRLAEEDWAGMAAGNDAILRGRLGDHLEQAHTAAREHMEASIEVWFDNDSSLAALCRERLGPVLADTHEDVVRLVREELEQQLGPAALRAELPDERLTDLDLAALDLDGIIRGILDGLPVESGLPAPAAVLDSMQIPVRRKLLDWLLLRRRATIRQRFFGSADDPDLPIPAAEKQRRLGDRGRSAMAEQVGWLLDPLAERSGGPLLDELQGTFRRELGRQLEQRCGELSAAVAAERATTDSELQALTGVLASIAGLRERVTAATATTASLTADLSTVDPRDLGRPADGLAVDHQGQE